jgi:hypothetical protein
VVTSYQIIEPQSISQPNPNVGDGYEMGIPEGSSVKAPREFPYSFGAFLDLVLSNKSLLDK